MWQRSETESQNLSKVQSKSGKHRNRKTSSQSDGEKQPTILVPVNDVSVVVEKLVSSASHCN
jgi:hypothetical protein